MTTMSKTAALKAANIFTVISGGVMFPYNMDDPEGPYTVIHCSDDEAGRCARKMRVAHALELMGHSFEDADLAAENAALDGGSARHMLNVADRWVNRWAKG